MGLSHVFRYVCLQSMGDDKGRPGREICYLEMSDTETYSKECG